MNSKKVLGDKMPRGGKRIFWNILMFVSTAVATTGSVWVLSKKGTAGTIGIVILAFLFVFGLIGFLVNEKKPARD